MPDARYEIPLALGHAHDAGDRHAISIDLEWQIGADDDAFIAAGESDDLRKTVDYDALVRLVTEAFTTRRFSLIEAAAEAVAQAVLAAFPAVETVEVEVRKPAAPIDAVFASVGVAVERSRGA